MTFISVRGKGDPNAEDGEYKMSVQMLYSVAFTIKMSKMGAHKMNGYFDFVVPPLEGLWNHRNAGSDIFDLFDGNKSSLRWTSIIRVPDFVTNDEFEWARREASKKKNLDLSKVELIRYDEGLCVQCLHVGHYDDEPATIDAMPNMLTTKDLFLIIQTQIKDSIMRFTSAILVKLLLRD